MHTLVRDHSFIYLRTEGLGGSSAMRTPVYCCHSDVIITVYKVRGWVWNLGFCAYVIYEYGPWSGSWATGTAVRAVWHSTLKQRTNSRHHHVRRPEKSPMAPDKRSAFEVIWHAQASSVCQDTSVTDASGNRCNFDENCMSMTTTARCNANNSQQAWK